MNYDYYNDIPLSEVCSRMVSDCGRPLKAIAADINKGYSTLYRELDANDEGGKLGVDTLVPLIRACITEPYKTPPPPLLWLNSKFGFRAMPIQAEPGCADVRDEALEDLQAIAKFQEGIRNRLPVNKLAALARAAQTEIEETLEQYRRECVGENGVIEKCENRNATKQENPHE